MKKSIFSFLLLCIVNYINAQQQAGPLPPKKVYPADSAENININTVLDWDAQSGVDYYEVKIDTTAGFNSTEFRWHQNAFIAFVNDGADTEFQVPGLLPGATYYWTVRVLTGTVYSSYGAVWRFTTQAVSGIGKIKPEDVLLNYNASSGNIVIQSPEKGNILIYNQVGATVKNSSFEKGESSFNMETYPKGIYFIRLQLNNSVLTKKIFIR